MSIVRSGEAYVVFEGSRRLQWGRTARGWRLRGVWPGPEDRRLLRRHLVAGGPLLVVIADEDLVVPALAEELSDVPPALTVLRRDDTVAELEVPLLDWLPAAARRRGERFVGKARRTLAATPRCLLPPLLFEPADDSGRRVRFALRTPAAGHLTDAILASAVEHAFGVERGNVKGVA